MKLKIGFLVPTSNYIPTLSKTLVKSLELGLSQGESFSYEILPEAGGFNTSPREIEEKIGNWAIKDNVDLIIAILSPAVLTDIKKVIHNYEIPIIINSLGEDIIHEKNGSEYLFVNSFNYWKSCWMQGYYLGKEVGKNVSTITSFLDSGYGSLFALSLGLESQQGQVVSAGITNFETDPERAMVSMHEAFSKSPDVIMGLYSGTDSINLIHQYHKFDLDKKPLLSGNEFMFDENVLKEALDLVDNIRYVTSWDINNESEENLLFKEKMSKVSKKPIHPYYLLAYETGLFISQLSDESEKELHEKLLDLKIESPRGSLSFNKNDHETKGRSYLIEIQKDENGEPYKKLVKEIEVPALYEEQEILAKRLDKQGWVNPYLIA